jgi:CheY-like chemotaxis protein
MYSLKPLESHRYHEADQRSCRVLLVEDNFDDQTLGKRTLESLEDVHEVLCFSNGYELIEYMEQQNANLHSTISSTPTVIIIDLNMPKMNGFEILERLKSEIFFHTLPIIVVSDSPSYENVSKAITLKAAAFFKKPLSTCDLHAFLRNGRIWPPKK